MANNYTYDYFAQKRKNEEKNKAQSSAATGGISQAAKNVAAIASKAAANRYGSFSDEKDELQAEKKWRREQNAQSSAAPSTKSAVTQKADTSPQKLGEAAQTAKAIVTPASPNRYGAYANEKDELQAEKKLQREREEQTAKPKSEPRGEYKFVSSLNDDNVKYNADGSALLTKDAEEEIVATFGSVFDGRKWDDFLEKKKSEWEKTKRGQSGGINPVTQTAPTNKLGKLTELASDTATAALRSNTAKPDQSASNRYGDFADEKDEIQAEKKWRREQAKEHDWDYFYEPGKIVAGGTVLNAIRQGNDIRLMVRETADEISSLLEFAKGLAVEEQRIEYIDDLKTSLYESEKWNECKDVVGRVLEFTLQNNSARQMFDPAYQKIMNTKSLANQLINAKIDKENIEAGNVGEGIYINGQGREAYADYRFGLGNYSNNGCGAIAVYNALISMGDYESPSNITSNMERRNGLMLGGVMGGNPAAIRDIIEQKGYEVTPLYFPTMTELQDAVKSGDTGILLFVHENGAHYVTIDYDTDSPKHFCTYNFYNDDEKMRKKYTLQFLYKSGNFPVAFYSISEGESSNEKS